MGVKFLLVALLPCLITALADSEYKACWNIELKDESMFCFGAINWPIDEENYYNAERQD